MGLEEEDNEENNDEDVDVDSGGNNGGNGGEPDWDGKLSLVVPVSAGTSAAVAKGQSAIDLYVNLLQSIECPTEDDIMTIKALLKPMHNGPKHKQQRGTLAAISTGEGHFHG
ncbi:hypothetical protein FRC12_023039 [Ceratobasidium sp. 428]|nr:hypothetical protein FRC12_023039 [Ceratobasidium sp. 428]